MTRRSFCFLFGAGVAGLALAPRLPVVSHQFTALTPMVDTIALHGLPLAESVTIAHRLYSGNGRGAYSLMAELPPIQGPLTMIQGGEGLSFSDGEGNPVTPNWVAPAYRKRA